MSERECRNTATPTFFITSVNGLQLLTIIKKVSILNFAGILDPPLKCVAKCIVIELFLVLLVKVFDNSYYA